MKKILSTLALAALLTGAASTLANAQPAPGNARSDGRTLIDSNITLGSDYPPISSKTFLSTPVLPLKKGAVLPSRGVIAARCMDRMISLRQHDFALGPRTVPYPVIGLMRCSNFSDTGSFVKVIASTTVIKINLKAGEVLHSGGYRIEANRSIQPGEPIPTVRVVFGEKYFILSIEEATTQKNAADAAKSQPALTIADDHAKLTDRDIALEAWRLSNASVREGILR